MPSRGSCGPCAESKRKIAHDNKLHRVSSRLPAFSKCSLVLVIISGTNHIEGRVPPFPCAGVGAYELHFPACVRTTAAGWVEGGLQLPAGRAVAPSLRAPPAPARAYQGRAGALGAGAGLTEGAAAAVAEDGGGGVRLLSPRLLRAHLPLGVLRILA